MPVVNNYFVRCLILSCALVTATTCFAVNLNNEALSSLEEPLAVHVGDTTLSLVGLLDLPYRIDFDDSSQSSGGFLGNFQIGAETQLDNSWTIGAAYFGQYDDNRVDDYVDNYALFLGGIWGTVSIGNVNAIVDNATRRRQNIGNGFLEFDQPLGNLSSEGIAYIGRYGPSNISLAIDENSNFDLGFTFQRPIGKRDYRLTARYVESELFVPTLIERSEIQSRALLGLVDLTYGSSIFDIGFGIEQLTINNQDYTRNYLSTGVSHKHGSWSFSAQAHYGEIEGQDEQSYSLGLAYDLARGLSVNLGINFADAETQLDGLSLLSADKSEGIISVRYSY
ncbi:porin [Arenicella sp.]|nr:porin [Arenicella sp.]